MAKENTLPGLSTRPQSTSESIVPSSGGTDVHHTHFSSLLPFDTDILWGWARICVHILEDDVNRKRIYNVLLGENSS